MCGNGIRCTVVLAHRTGRVQTGAVGVMTRAGLRTVHLHDDGATSTVDMGEPVVEAVGVPQGSSLRITVDGLTGTGVSMGNPHLVLFLDDNPSLALDDETVLLLGPKLERHEAFPQKTNVEFVEVLDETAVNMRVWERGVGETMACGSGACAVAVAAAALGRTKREVDVHLPGGTLTISWGEDGHVRMTGPAAESFAGELDVATFASPKR
jgi:diaminopimelate epimerase